MSLLDTPVSLENDPIAGPLLARLRALEEHARQLAADRDMAALRAGAAEKRCGELEDACRWLRDANEAWRTRFEDLERTVELPKLPAEPEPKRRGRWRR